MERLIELFINTEDGEFYDRGGLLAAYDPAINAGELVRLTVQLCAGVPAFNSAGALLNPDTTFAGTLAAAETIIDNNFNWYDKGTLLENLTTGTAISELSVASEASPRPLGAVRLNAGTVVNFCGWTATEGGYRLTLADNEFNPAQFTPTADFAHGAEVEVLEQPIIVSAQNDDSGRATGLFTGLLDAANPVYESMIEGHEDIPNCRIEFSIYQDGRAVFRARRYFDCLGAMAMNKGAAYVHSDSWREADSRYIKLVDWQAPPEYQFSEDGTNWHDQQQDADLYYHERRPGGQWGPAVKMKIGQTGAAAGFGAPTIAVETLPAGSDATASVTASGDDTAKVFNFNFGIPKGADGQNGTNGADGAAGADGVSSYTYVAYASDASGTGFSLTPTNALKYRAEIHTTTAIETPDAEDFAGATWVKYIGDDGTGTGDMTKSVYDTNNDGIVDHAATADAVGATTAAQVADAVGKAHTHANKATLDKLAEADGKLTFDGSEIGGASNWNDITGKPETFPPSAHNHAITDVTGLEDALQNAGSVKSVNGQLPDESGNVTVETGSTVDESRLLPTGGRNGNLLEYQEGADRGNNVNTKLLLQPATSDGLIVDQAAGNAAPVGITNSGNVAIAANALVFSGENALIIEPDTLGMTLGGNNEYSIEVDFQLDQVKSDWATLFGGDGSMTRSAFYINSSGATAVQGGIAPDTTGWTTGTRHRLTIERFQDGDSWKTVIYRNGAVLATSVTTPNTLSGDRFPIGSNLEGTGRNFVGKIWAFRISNKAEHRGVSFTPRELPFLPPAGQPVWTEGIDRSRLLPEDPANGDIPCFDATATIGGGNDANTRLLLQPSTSDHGIVDQAAGNAAPVTLENHNVTVDEEGNMVFDGSNAYLKIPANTLPSDFFNGTDEWTLDIVYNVASKGMQCLFGCSSSLRMDFLLDSDGSLQIGAGPNLGTGWPFNEDVHLTFEIYKDGTVWKYTIFRNGSVVTTGTWVNADWRSVAQYVGWEGESDSRKINGKIKALRLTSGALHKGAAFQSDYPWTRPQTVGEWSKLNKSELAMKSDFPSGNIVTNISGATADSTGYVNLNDTGTYDFFAVKNNTVPWAAPPSVLMPIGSRRVQRFYSENTAALSLSDNSLFPFVPEELGDGRFVTLKPTDASQPMWFGICTDGFKMEISNFTVCLHGDTDCSFEYELYGSAYEESDYSPLNGRWNLVHSGEIYLINNGDFKTATEDIPIASRGYYRSYAFVMKNVSGPGIISWNPEYIGNSWGRLTPVLSVNGHYVSANTNEITLPAATASAAGLMAAEDKAVIAGLTARGIYPELYNVADPIDFNQLTTQGFYFIGGGADHINYPGTNAKLPGTLTVLRRGNYLTQTFSAVGAIGTSVWERNMYRANIGDAFTITDWHRLISDTDITESKAQPGYFKLPNGTIVQWGSFMITADPQAQEITLPVALSSIYSKQVSGSNSSLKIGIYGGTNGKITCYVEGSTSGTVDWMVIGK